MKLGLLGKFRLIVLTIFLLIGSNISYTQIVTIPDNNFAAQLAIIFPSCISGNQLDTQCPDVLNATTLGVPSSNISDLTGLEYFINLETFNCNVNNLTSLPALPASLISLNCHNNQLTSLPSLPSGLEVLNCGLNNLVSLPPLPPNLQTLNCVQNSLTSLPSLPNSLVWLQCQFNQLTTLPVLPNSLVYFRCNNNNLVSIPDIPLGVNDFKCDNNQLTYLPSLPTNLTFFSCHNNPNLFCLPPLPNSLGNCGDVVGVFNLSGTQITCVPNIPPFFAGTSVPVCVLGSSTNPNNCDQASIISGKIYHDLNSNCSLELTDNEVTGVKVYLTNSTNDTIGLAYSDDLGNYEFVSPSSGNYTVHLDSMNQPFTLNCNYPGVDTIISVSSGVQNGNVDFGIDCPNYSDIAINSVVREGIAFPGQQHKVIVNIGNIVTELMPDCATSVGGLVTIQVNGNVTYLETPPYALLPNTLIGNTFEYVIPDYSLLNIDSAFHLVFQTNTDAVAGDMICVEVSINTDLPDFDLYNNQYVYCYQVVNSFDPNIKEVYPVSVLPGYNDYLIYTIYFQNTGNAPAFNIKITDTLEANLISNTFELIGSSHSVNVELIDNKLEFRFDNIMLPDSTSNPDGSIGYVQFRVKPQNNLSEGTNILNKAYIYFDYNSPIITNSSITVFEINDNSIHESISNGISIFPNPSNGIFTTVLPHFASPIEMRVYNIYGEQVEIITTQGDGFITIDISNEPCGMYWIQYYYESQLYCAKIIKY